MRGPLSMFRSAFRFSFNPDQSHFSL